MKKSLFCRFGALCLIVAICMMSFGNLVFASFSSGGNSREAYKDVVLEMIQEKGIGGIEMYKNKDTFATELRYHDGVIAVMCEDLLGITAFGTSDDELVISWVDSASGTIETAVYVYQNTIAMERGRLSAPLGAQIAGFRQGTMFLLTYGQYGSMRTHYRHGIFWNGDGFQDVHLPEDANDNGVEGIVTMCGMHVQNFIDVLKIKSGVGGGEGAFYASGYEQTDYSLAECLAKMGISAGGFSSGTATRALSTIEYYGDYSKCKMPADMANAYADVLDRLPSYTKGVLIDIAGDGMPLLMAAGEKDLVWSWNGTAAVPFESSYDPLLGYFDGIPVISNNDFTQDVGVPMHRKYYRIANGNLSLLHEHKYVPNDDGLYGKEYWDGKEINPADIAQYDKFSATYSLYSEWTTAEATLRSDLSPAGEMAKALRLYANGGSRYKGFSMVDNTADEHADAVSQAVLNGVGGKIVDIYRLSDGLYYIIIELDGGEKGVLVKGVLQNGSLNWNVTATHDTPLEESALTQIATDTVSRSNISLDYGKISSFDSARDLCKYLSACLDNIDGTAPNDMAMNELISFVETAISSICADSVSARGNKITLNKKMLGDLVSKAQSIKDEVNSLFSEKGVTPGKEITVIIRIVWKNYKADKPCKITIDDAFAEQLNGASVRLLLGDSNCYVQISSEHAKALADTYGAVNIAFSKTGENTFAIEFQTEQGEKIDRLPAPVTFGVPASGMLCTIMASYAGGSDNWGGQFDQNAGIISFETPYSGQYEVLENNVQIDDIGNLSEESQKAIRFLVSKGYLGLDGTNFLPEGTLSRYQFTQALVGMFFALDRSLETSFEDVPQDSPFYPYVASAEAKDIVEGYSKTTFGGEINMTVEQMLSLAGRTLIDQKGYSVPVNTEEYLTSFSDRDKISDWARSQVALSVRDGLFDRTDMLNPQAEITREQAAVILYRLFLLLYEVPPVELNMPMSANAKAIAAAAAVGGGVLLVGGGMMALWMLKRKKKLK